MGEHLNYGGLVVAGIGFFLTRFTVSLAIYEDPTRFLLAGLVPLALGLGLAAFGVALAVADVETRLVRTTAVWCAIGAGTMLVLTVLTLLGSTPGDPLDPVALRSRTYLSNFLIGGSVGGTLTGLYAARNRRQREEVRHQANRLEVMNRMLRHEVLNALTAIRGFAGVHATESHDAQAVIEERSDGIEATIEKVRYLTRSARFNEQWGVRVDLHEHLEASVAAIEAAHPEAEVTLEVPEDAPPVIANDRLEEVFTQLVENAIVHGTATHGHRDRDESEDHGGDQSVTVRVTSTTDRVSVRVIDQGPGLPDRQRRLLETGEIGTFDDPKSGYGLNVVRLLVESYSGSIETDVTDAGSTVTVSLPRAPDVGTGLRPSPKGLAGVRPTLPHLIVTLVSSLLAGIVYGLSAETMGGSIAGIGVFYGSVDPVVGWLTHEFHSIVFGFVYVSLLSLVSDRVRDRLATYVGVGLGWAVVLWLLAAGIVAPLWLRLLGTPAPVPSLSVDLLVNHLAWGLSLGLLTAVGYRHGIPLLARIGERLG